VFAMGILDPFNKFINNSKHVLSISYKPTRAEFDRASKLVIFGMLIIGVIGFALALIISLIITGSLSLI
jgi:protein translocase SEC61 complex gamma subunit